MVNIGIIGSDAPKMREFMVEAKRTLKIPVIFVEFKEDEALEAVKMANNKELDLLMKGLIPTKTMLQAVLNKEYSLKKSKLLSHVSLVHFPSLHCEFLLTDAAMNIQPSINDLEIIVEHAVEVAKNMGKTKPKVALLSSVEKVNSKMLSSKHAAILTETFQNREDALVYGPISLDIALSKEAARIKDFKGLIVGDADILVVPSIDAGNFLYKSLQLYSDAMIGGIIVGAKVPIVLTSRSDTNESRLHALKFALRQVERLD